MNRQEALDAASELAGTPAERVSALGGAAYLIYLRSGERVVVKSHGEPNAVVAEAASLRWLGEPGAVPVPRVLGSNERWLLTDYVEPGGPHVGAAQSFGLGLARLHATGAPAFGAPPPGGPVDASIGLAPMRNVECGTWTKLYGSHRIEPYLRSAVDAGTYSAADTSIFRRVIDRLDELAGPPEPPARLHGDLWSGNVLWSSNGEAWLIDPAAHGGHRETDLAMLHLFGCPYLDHIIGAYEEEAPLADGWRSRIPLHQLFPLLVHTVLFGGGYASQAVSAARESLAV